MFNNLSDRLLTTFDKLRGQSRINEENIGSALKEVRNALLEADVALPVVTEFLDAVKTKALGQVVLKSINPSQSFVKVVHDELVHIMGDENAELNLATKPPAVILMAGLQGSGKTTSSAKLAHRLQTRDKKKVLLTSADIYRPAAIDQLESLAKQINADFYRPQLPANPTNIAKAALDMARKCQSDVVILDTAGRLHIDEEMMAEIKTLHQTVDPIETLFVVDSMTGQDAANTAKAFNDALALTGVILSKADGDARGGAALSVRQITQKPIKFIGVGEKIDALQAFHPDRIASQILGMGDVLSLVEEAETKLDKKAQEKLSKKIKKGRGFDFEDFLSQLEQMQKMGGMMSIMGKLPGMAKIPQAAKDQMSDGAMVSARSIIQSMTPQERQFPKLISGSRKRRIAAGCGREIPEVNRLLKQFEQMQKMMKKMSKPGAMKKMMGKLPPGTLPDDLPPF